MTQIQTMEGHGMVGKFTMALTQKVLQMNLMTMMEIHLLTQLNSIGIQIHLVMTPIKMVCLMAGKILTQIDWWMEVDVVLILQMEAINLQIQTMMVQIT